MDLSTCSHSKFNLGSDLFYSYLIEGKLNIYMLDLWEQILVKF